MKNKNNLVIAGIVGGVILLTIILKTADIKIPQAPPPSPQQVLSFTGWQDAVNKDYGYSLKMPHDWSLVQIAGEPAYPQRMKLINVKPEEQRKPHVGIIVTATKLQGKDLESQPEVVSLMDEGRVPKRLTMAGSPAMLIENLGESREEYSVFIAHKDYLYRFDWTGTHPDVRKQYKDTGLKILASLKFM